MASRWLIENNLMSNFFVEEGSDALAKYRAGELSILGLYEWWDTCLISDMLSEEGNAFAMHYFDYERGKYISDYKSTLQGNLPNEFHIPYTEDNYAKIKSVIDQRYVEWKNKKLNPWWRFWK